MKVANTNNRLALATAFCMAAIWAGTAQAKNTLNCTIVDHAGSPIPKQEVVLTSSGNGKEWKKKTNDKGLVEFKGLDDGSYVLRGEVAGYLFAKSAPIQLSGNTVAPCNHTLPGVDFYNALLQETLQAVKEKKFPVAE